MILYDLEPKEVILLDLKKLSRKKVRLLFSEHSVEPAFQSIIKMYCEFLGYIQVGLVFIGGFNQRQGEALPPQIFLTLSPFVVTVQTRKIGSVYSQENYRNCCHLMSDFKAKRHQIRCRLGIRPRPR